MKSWIPPASLPDSIITPLHQILERIPSQHFKTPQVGEVLSSDKVYDCLQNYAFTQGFCVVVTSHDKANTYIRYACIHYGTTTRNWHGLDDYRMEEGNKQKEYTNIQARGCPWQVYISYRGVTRGRFFRDYFFTLFTNYLI
jgi:hypothetical protein